MAKAKREIKVTVVGAGIAGLTAALRLAQRGYKVTVYEQQDCVGGNLGGFEQNGIWHDVYRHMFTNWYLNFWQLAESIGLSQDEDFEPLSAFKFLRAGDFPNFKTLTNAASLRAVAADLFSGLSCPPDIFLWAYSIIDLLSQHFDERKPLGRESVNGFISSRPYASNRMAQLHDEFIQTIWAVPSYLSSASAYQDYLKYQVRHPNPQAWVLKGNVYESFMTPLQAELARYGCKVEKPAYVNAVTVKDGKVDKIFFREGTTVRDDSVDYLILAVPANYLAFLVMGPDIVPDPSLYGGKPLEGAQQEQRIIDVLPQLAELRRLHSEPIPVLDVYFKKALPCIPREYVALLESQFDLTFVSIPNSKGGTALAVAASDFYALPDPIKKGEPPQRAVSPPSQEMTDPFSILEELNRYVPFKLGKSWGDSESDVDWVNSAFRANTDHELFINEVGYEQWSIEPSYKELPNLFFAGDFCKTNIEITCVEGAVVSGLQAARALWNRERLGDPITIAKPEAFPPNFMAFLKLGLAPLAFGAKVWSLAIDFREKVKSDRLPEVSNLVDKLLIPCALAVELWRTVRSVYEVDKTNGPNDRADSASYQKRWRVKP